MNNQTVVGVFDNASEARQAASELQAAGFQQDSIDVASRGDMSSSSSSSASGSMSSTDSTPDWNDRNTSGTAVEGAVDYAGRKVEEGGSAIGRFFKNLFTDDDDAATRFSGVAERSNSIVTVHADSDDRARQAAEILDRCGAIDVDERSAEYGYGASAGSANMSTGARTADAGQTVQVIQEDLQVGKREVETGGARLRARVVSRPVEETLRLREERVFVERTAVNRPASEADFNTFKEGTIELRETAEVPVVQKEARVVEEVSLGKEATERTETIRDSVRNTEVDVEKFDGDETRRTSSQQGGNGSAGSI